MSLNTQQKLLLVAVVGGLATLPAVYASRNSTPATENPQTIQTLKNTTTIQYSTGQQSGSGYITNANNGSTIVVPPKVTAPSQPSIAGQGPAARTTNGMLPSDYPANDQMGQFINNNGNGFNNTMPSSTGHHCEYSKDAIKAGVKHYWFEQANEGTLVEVGGGHKLTPEAAAALRQLQAAARADGVTLTVGSAFRSVSYQQGIVSRKKAAGQSDAQIYKVSSAPHYSEHHTGYAVDFSPINNSFAGTKAYDWLRKNAPAMGWEQSFTPESTRDTRVAVESWHWKYKGSPTAKAALANDVCY